VSVVDGCHVAIPPWCPGGRVDVCDPGARSAGARRLVLFGILQGVDLRLDSRFPIGRIIGFAACPARPFERPEIIPEAMQLLAHHGIDGLRNRGNLVAHGAADGIFPADPRPARRQKQLLFSPACAIQLHRSAANRTSRGDVPHLPDGRRHQGNSATSPRCCRYQETTRSFFPLEACRGGSQTRLAAMEQQLCSVFCQQPQCTAAVDPGRRSADRTGGSDNLHGLP